MGDSEELNCGAGGKEKSKRYSEIFRDFDALEICIGNSVVDILLGDADTQSISTTASLETQDTDELPSDEGFCVEYRTDCEDKELSVITAQNADAALLRSEGGVETALLYAKLWCKYAKELLTWMERRLSLELDFAKNIIKTAETAKSSVAPQEFMPLQYIYTMALEHDVKSGNSAKETGDLMQHRCIQALHAKRNEIEKWRKEFKEQWSREQRRMSETVSCLKKARQQYVQRCEELEKARVSSARAEEETGAAGSGSKTLDKRRRTQDEAHCKVQEATAHYKACVTEANTRQQELSKVKERIVSHVRKLILQGDHVLKEVTVNMFHYQRLQMEPAPQGFLNLELTCRPCEPGETYLSFIQKRRLRDLPVERFTFQEALPQGKRSSSSGHQKVCSNQPSPVMDMSPLPDETCGRSSVGTRPGSGDAESLGGSFESPLSSPAHLGRKLWKTPSTGTMSSEDLEEKEAGSQYDGESGDNYGTLGSRLKKVSLSRAAQTHRLRKSKGKMSKCRQCDNYIYMSGIECEECNLAFHRKCLELCVQECEDRKLGAQGGVFGVEFALVPRGFPEEVPFIVRRCTAEIESRALGVQGVYRVSGAKPRIQKLCQSFESQREQVELSEHSPHDITGVLKHFLKELPEPVVVFDLYDEFMALGKDIQRVSDGHDSPEAAGILDLSARDLLGKLPASNYNTLRHIIAHLYRVSEQFEENKMSPSNLGIIFGPTLLRPLVAGEVSMMALLDSGYQALLVEFLISHYESVFGLDELPRSSPVLAGGEGARDRQAQRPRSLESLPMKRDSSEGYISDKSSSNEAVDQLSPDTNERAVVDSAMTPALASTEGADVDSVSAGSTQSRGHFSRQPIKYQRQPVPSRILPVILKGSLPRIPSELQSEDKSSLERRARPGSRSSTPERPRLEITQETARLLCKAHGEGSGIRLLQDTSSEASKEEWKPAGHDQAERPCEESQVEGLAMCNNNQSNSNRVCAGDGNPVEQILSGLRLRQTDTAEGRQLHFM
ncbi:GEM-interacting protein-like isoform X2 [Acipenser ruthenus]|uniref:GEM-interacting protein-like isoform X2 n=1 Tax=Acipenser ruthenus TaxID=7906 RepID=UPI00274073FC|nr:GEM-interacting protein-like isoform X2 [Acipenser ruthenus]XP_058864115.1 GEM-interacting protein-like isoform X2 [Acipenser ruthenus]